MKLSDIKHMGRFKNLTTNQVYSIKKGLNKARGTHHYFYIKNGNYKPISAREYFDNHERIGN
jgi:hypothetical protein